MLPVSRSPELLRQWHPTKNGDLDPCNVAANTSKKLWWKCPEGPDHEWQATGDKRVQGRGCPYCAGKRVSVTNSLVNFPELAVQFHPTRNGELTPADLASGTTRRIWWLCPSGTDHEWQAAPCTRLRQGRMVTCPFCTGKRPSITNNLSNFPELVAQFHPAKNGDLTPSDVVAGTNKKLWWKCPKGPDHEWQAQGNERVSGTGCPCCRGLKPSVTNNLENFPDLVAQFHPTKNGDLTPGSIVAGSEIRLWWKCPKGPDHEWQATSANRSRGTGCPYCRGLKVSVSKSLVDWPELAARFHPTRNGDVTPSAVVAGTNKKLWWRCAVGPDHEWRATGNSRVSSETGCPSCAQYGFRPAEDGWLYLVKNDDLGLLQIGISNRPDRRVRAHGQRGWVEIDRLGPISGKDARKLEKLILSTLTTKGIELGPMTDAGKFDGFTESWRFLDFPVNSFSDLNRLTDSIGESQ